MTTKVETASTSKWPIAMMLTGLVKDGSIKSLDSKANEYVPWYVWYGGMWYIVKWYDTFGIFQFVFSLATNRIWSSILLRWTKNVSDYRSNVTLRHLLSFTSGFGDGSPGQENSSVTTCLDNSTVNFDSCAKWLHDNIEVAGEPGTTWSYNSNHLQLAGAVAVHASKLDIQSVVRKYLLEPYHMNETSCFDGHTNPELAVCLTTTGKDYANFLHATHTYRVLGKELVDESEFDSTPFMERGYQLYGNYGFGHFLECFDSVSGFTEKCRKARVHCDPGAFG